MKILVIGDLIVDQYKMCDATRLCPEAPVPVLVQNSKTYETKGGAGLVVEQLKALIGEEHVVGQLGSVSRKQRIFADERLVTRIDYDRVAVCDAHEYESRVIKALKTKEFNVLIISDYDKGAMTEHMAGRIMKAAKILGIPTFVDAKNSWQWYPKAYAYFPNATETNLFNWKGLTGKYTNIIHKQGHLGCKVNGQPIPTSSHDVRDTTGAGDVFIAAFAAAFLCEIVLEMESLPTNGKGTITQNALERCARFANFVAGMSVEHVGTRVVTKAEVTERYHQETKS